MIFLSQNNSVFGLVSRGYPMGILMSPRHAAKPCRKGQWVPWAADNGLFRPLGMDPAPDAERLMIYGLLARSVADSWPNPMFAVVPDVPYDGYKSLAVSRYHLPLMRQVFRNYSLAIAVQDGMEIEPETVNGFDWIFVGGSDGWKDKTCCKWAKLGAKLGMKVHLAKVNERSRVMMGRGCGVDSCDGTGIWRGDLKQKQRVLNALIQPELEGMCGV